MYDIYDKYDRYDGYITVVEVMRDGLNAVIELAYMDA